MTQGRNCSGDNLLLMFKRWKKIEEDFVVKGDNEKFDISKLPEICDNIKFEMIHIPDFRNDENRLKLLKLSILMCMIVVPFEYGILDEQKINIGVKITTQLVQKINCDLTWWKTQNLE